jgi:hypothetical protein
MCFTSSSRPVDFVSYKKRDATSQNEEGTRPATVAKIMQNLGA